MGVEFLPEIGEERLVIRDSDCAVLLRRPDPVVPAFLGSLHERPTFLLGPSRAGLKHLSLLQSQSGKVRSRFRILSHVALRKSLMSRIGALLTRNAVYGLFDAHPQFSARTVISASQAIALTAIVFALVLLGLHFPRALFDGVRVAATVAFFSCTLLRVLAAVQSRDCTGHAMRKPDEPEPVYSILVPLRDEADIVPQLLAALGRIVWPRDRLEIKLICEADDRATIEAIRAHGLRDYVELIEVPASLPRTKPKALRYALQASRGEFVVLYDAEDIPHPMQLQEAWRRFAAAGPDLACLQAPLHISNARASWIARMFAFEYAGLFRCLLPWLASHGSVLPLGGTSNHFRRAALEDVGAWDPHNVTEDADLGIRLARFGYRCDVISLPTMEEAPEEFSVWRPQRTRWCKGWLQTWLVHMRRPDRFAADVGLPSFLISQALLFGIVFSSLVHPLLLVTIGYFVWYAVSGFEIGPYEAAMFGLDAFNIACGYAGFVAIGLVGSRGRWRGQHWSILIATPAYWLMMSCAAWMALYELCWRPFHWNKTPHKPVRRRMG